MALGGRQGSTSAHGLWTTLGKQTARRGTYDAVKVWVVTTRCFEYWNWRVRLFSKGDLCRTTKTKTTKQLTQNRANKPLSMMCCNINNYCARMPDGVSGAENDPFPELEAYPPEYLARHSRKARHQKQSVGDYVSLLTHLHLEGGQHRALLSFRGAPALKVLFAQENLLEECGKALATCPELTHLYLGQNRIRDMTLGLRWLKRLRVLHIGGNELTVIEGLENMCCLEELHVEGQCLAQRRAQDGRQRPAPAPAVRRLYGHLWEKEGMAPGGERDRAHCELQPRERSPRALQFCKLSFLSLGSRGTLLALDLSNNGLVSCDEALLALTSLQTLDMRSNALGSAAALRALCAACRQLRVLDTRGNPMHRVQRDVRSRLIVAAPRSLQLLDGLQVASAQREGLLRLEDHRRRVRRRAGAGEAGERDDEHEELEGYGDGGGAVFSSNSLSRRPVHTPGGNPVHNSSPDRGASFRGAAQSSFAAHSPPTYRASVPPHRGPGVMVRDEHEWAGKTLGSRTSSKGMIPRQIRRRQQLAVAPLVHLKGAGDALDKHMVVASSSRGSSRVAAQRRGVAIGRSGVRPSVHGTSDLGVFAAAGQALTRNTSHVFFRH